MVDNIIKEATYAYCTEIPKGETFYHVPYQEAERVDIRNYCVMIFTTIKGVN